MTNSIKGKRSRNTLSRSEDTGQMDITDFIVTRRADALLVGDHNSYRAQLTRRIHGLRKRLGRTTPKSKKYTTKPRITAEDVGNNTEFVHLLLLSSERAWATAMHEKSVHSADPSTKGITGSTRRHIISRLHKALIYAKQLVENLENREKSHASAIDLLEARAYQATLSGAFWMEKQRWTDCLRQYSLARVIYTAIDKQSSRQTLRDLLSGTVDPTIRYSAYQQKLSRSTPVSSIAIRYFPVDSVAKKEVEAIDPDCLKEQSGEGQTGADGSSQSLPQSITWRSRTVPLEDATISQALAATTTAESQLTSWLSSSEGQSSTPKETASNYDNVIIASQDAVDATKTAIDDLLGEGVDQSDKRMQALQVTRTAVNYTLVGWRVGRNRLLCGLGDGLDVEPSQLEKRRVRQGAPENQELSMGRQLTHFRERVVLYDSILQSLDSVLELPGVTGDASFMEELDGKRRYFQSLRCLALGKSHAVLSNTKNALALFARGLDIAPRNAGSASDGGGPLRTDIPETQLQTLSTRLQGFVWQYQGIVEIEKRSTEENEANSTAQQLPSIERLDEYSCRNSDDLTNLVPYPPKVKPIPVKPVFLDVAFNYIDYPREEKKAVVSEAAETKPAAEPKKETKRGWFGFGR